MLNIIKKEGKKKKAHSFFELIVSEIFKKILIYFRNRRQIFNDNEKQNFHQMYARIFYNLIVK